MRELIEKAKKFKVWIFSILFLGFWDLYFIINE